MAKNKEPETAKGEAVAKKGKSPLILAAVGIVVAAGATFAVTTVMGKQDAETAETAKAEGDIVPLESFVVNLADKDAARFARVGLAAVFAEGAESEAVTARMPLVRNAMLRVFVPKTSRDLTELSGLDKLHEELSAAARAVYPDGSLLRVVVTDVVVQ